MKRNIIWIAVFMLFFASCRPEGDGADAYGNFEAVELLVSSESQGKILWFDPVEGDNVTQNQVVAVLDSTQLYLKKKQLQTGLVSIGARLRTLDAQIEAQQVQMDNLLREKQRIENLFERGAATSKQRDDINGQVTLQEAQIAATASQKASVEAERGSIEIQIQQVEDQLHKCLIRNPRPGTILNKFKEAGEFTAPGQSLYKLANLNELILRVYVTGNQLSQIKLGGEVTVQYDSTKGLERVPGKVAWISSQAEFTPKVIQTREERVSLVYAVKIRVPNDGTLKIGMPGEILFTSISN
jgi:HlyD family secretion protein